METKGKRVAKVIADYGYCSKREAERLIFAGDVKVNGEVITSPAVFITDQSIKIKNKLITKTETSSKVWLFNKPKGYIVTNNDPQKRNTIYDILPKTLPRRIVSVGRLDMNTEGLLLLTNNGELARYISHPSTAWSRQYRVKVHGNLKKINFELLSKNGIVVDGIKYAPIKVTIEKASETTNTWLKVVINEGKNREIRKIMEHFGLKVARLIRISFGPFHLGKMPSCSVKQVSAKALKEAIGNKVNLKK
jgi:23S rRNA pseudouridine2605 synthase